MRQDPEARNVPGAIPRLTLELNATVTDLMAELTEGGGTFDAPFVAVGAHIGKRAYIPAGDSARIMDAVSLLHRVEDGSAPMLGRPRSRTPATASW